MESSAFSPNNTSILVRQVLWLHGSSVLGQVFGQLRLHGRNVHRTDNTKVSQVLGVWNLFLSPLDLPSTVLSMVEPAS